MLRCAPKTEAKLTAKHAAGLRIKGRDGPEDDHGERKECPLQNKPYIVMLLEPNRLWR